MYFNYSIFVCVYILFMAFIGILYSKSCGLCVLTVPSVASEHRITVLL